MSVGRNNYLMICCQSCKCILFPVHLEGTLLSSFPLFSLWGCFILSTFGFFAMHTRKYWVSPGSRTDKQSLCCTLGIISTDDFSSERDEKSLSEILIQTRFSDVYWNPPKQNNPPVSAANAIFHLDLMYESTFIAVCLVALPFSVAAETQRHGLFSFHTCPRC